MSSLSKGRTGKEMFRFGLHVSIAGGIDRIFERGESLSCGVVQLFSHSSRSWEFHLPEEDSLLPYHRSRTDSSVSRVFIHASYLINIASEDESIRRRSTETLRKELQTADLLKADGLVLHPGSAKNGSREGALERAAELLRDVLDGISGLQTPLLLENTAGAGSMLGSTSEEMKILFDLVDQPEKIGLCLDSCHLFASGYDLNAPGVYEKVLKDFRKAVPSEKISLWHLNDALFGLGSGKDRHAGLGEGKIGIPALTRIVLGAVSEGVPVVLETPKGEGEFLDRMNLRRLYEMAGMSTPECLIDDP